MLLSINFIAQAALLFSAGCQAASLQRRATTCNGHSELCNVSYGNVSFVGAHNSYAVGTNNLAANQDHDVTQQLNDGIRLLQLQVHDREGVIQLCHTSCSLYNGGTLEDYLGKVKLWLDANLEDVVTILIVNSDNFAASAFDTVFQAAGVSSMSYSPESAFLTFDAWPTLGTLIDAGTRLVTFLDNAADFTAVPYLLDEFTNIWETAYDVTDTTFNCAVDRTQGETTTQMYLINHFLDKLVLGQPAPDVANANSTNSVDGVGGLGIQVQTCVADHGRAPNFLLVDFYEYGGGSVFEVAASINGVEYAPSSPIATPQSTSSSSSDNGDNVDGALAFRSSGLWIAGISVLLSAAFGASVVV